MSTSPKGADTKFGEFRRVVRAFAECLERGLLEWDHHLWGMALTGRERNLGPVLRKHKVSRKRLHAVMEEELLPIVQALLLSPNTLSDATGGRAARAKLVRETLITPELEATTQFYATAKHPVLRGLDWEVSAKLAERDIAPTGRLTYATLSLEVESETDRIGQMLRTSGRHVFICGRKELDRLLEEMHALSDAMREAAEGVRRQ